MKSTWSVGHPNAEDIAEVDWSCCSYGEQRPAKQVIYGEMRFSKASRLQSNEIQGQPEKWLVLGRHYADGAGEISPKSYAVVNTDQKGLLQVLGWLQTSMGA